MSARKLGRFAGLVFVLAVVFGGVGAASIDHAHTAPATTAAATVSHVADVNIEWD